VLAEVVILYGLQCQSGDCPKTAQIFPVVAPVVVQAEIYRPTLLNRLLRKSRPVSVIVIQPEPAKADKAAK
jgi:hypothetical protein